MISDAEVQAARAAALAAEQEYRRTQGMAVPSDLALSDGALRAGLEIVAAPGPLTKWDALLIHAMGRL
ncbi:MAG TPA: hypothetical protein VFR34_00885, partial [Paracoccaceae bacterium]|nr:hypothetical protein [Paracoccaceae bacterium]